MSQAIDSKSNLFSNLKYPIGIFAIVGSGLGLTAAILMAVLGGGSALFSGLTTLIAIAVALLLGPVVAAIVGTHMSSREQHSAPISSLIGCSIGFIIMMVVVLLILFLGIALPSMGGASGGTGGAPTGGSSGGGGFDMMQYIFPIILVAIPTGLVGAAASALHTRSGFHAAGTGAAGTGNQMDIPTKYVAGAIIGILLIAGVGYGATAVLSSPADNLEVQGDAYSQGDSLYADAAILNTGSNTATAELTVRMSFDGETKDSWTNTQEITVQGDGEVDKAIELGTYSELTTQEGEAIQNENFEIEFLINGEVKDAYTES